MNPIPQVSHNVFFTDTGFFSNLDRRMRAFKLAEKTAILCVAFLIPSAIMFKVAVLYPTIPLIYRMCALFVGFALSLNIVSDIALVVKNSMRRNNLIGG